MKFKMAENSLFAILLRAPWWVSVLAAAAAIALVRFFLAIEYALFASTPFLIIAGIVIWRRLRTPSGARLEAALERVRAMSWEAFAAALEEGFRREGYLPKRSQGAADFELERYGRVSLAAAKRWKASRTGVEPLRELQAAAAALPAEDAGECLYLCAGEITVTARAYAAEKNIRLVEGLELAKLAGVL